MKGTPECERFCKELEISQAGGGAVRYCRHAHLTAPACVGAAIGRAPPAERGHRPPDRARRDDRRARRVRRRRPAVRRSDPRLGHLRGLHPGGGGRVLARSAHHRGAALVDVVRVRHLDLRPRQRAVGGVDRTPPQPADPVDLRRDVADAVPVLLRRDHRARPRERAARAGEDLAGRHHRRARGHRDRRGDRGAPGACVGVGQHRGRRSPRWPTRCATCCSLRWSSACSRCAAGGWTGCGRCWAPASSRWRRPTACTRCRSPAGRRLRAPRRTSPTTSACCCWRSPRGSRERRWRPTACRARPVLGIPAAFTLSALGLLDLRPLQPPGPARARAGDGARCSPRSRARRLAFRDVRALAETRRQALTDDLTSMPNRRHFLRLPARRDHRQQGERHERGAADGRPRPLQGAQRHARPRRRRPAAAARWASGCARCCAPPTRPPGWAATSSGCCWRLHAMRRSAELVAEKILEAIGQPFPIKGVNLRVTGEHRHRAVPRARRERRAADAACRRGDVRGQEPRSPGAPATRASATSTRWSA